MKRITLVACEMLDGKKIELGRDENFPEAESVGDIMDLCDGDNPEMTEEQVIGAFNSGNKVRRQASLRSPGKKTDNPQVAAFKKASPADQEKILRELGLL